MTKQFWRKWPLRCSFKPTINPQGTWLYEWHQGPSAKYGNMEFYSTLLQWLPEKSPSTFVNKTLIEKNSNETLTAVKHFPKLFRLDTYTTYSFVVIILLNNKFHQFIINITKIINPKLISQSNTIWNGVLWTVTTLGTIASLRKSPCSIECTKETVKIVSRYLHNIIIIIMTNIIICFENTKIIVV